MEDILAIVNIQVSKLGTFRRRRRLRFRFLDMIPRNVSGSSSNSLLLMQLSLIMTHIIYIRLFDRFRVSACASLTYIPKYVLSSKYIYRDLRMYSN